MKTNLKTQLDAFNAGRILDSDGTESTCFNFYDWFCKDSSLENKSIKLFKQVKTFIKNKPSINVNTTYVFFKNNCPVNGPLYDDFRICDVETGNVLFTVIAKCSHSRKAEIWGYDDSGKFGCLTQAETFSKLFL